jgi:hypothetical protein
MRHLLLPFIVFFAQLGCFFVVLIALVLTYDKVKDWWASRNHLRFQAERMSSALRGEAHHLSGARRTLS